MIERLKALLGNENVLVNENLKEYTTFRVGGPAKAVLNINTVEELKSVLCLIKEESALYMVLGNGSNLLVSDEGYEGFVLRLLGDFQAVSIDGNTVTAGAGTILSKVCITARDKGLSGLEFAYGIPGTVGGAMVMNAGAYGGEMAMVVDTVTLLFTDGQIKDFTNSDMCFGYRDSFLKHNEAVVIKTVFKLMPKDTETIQAAMSDFLERRKSKQPLEYPSAGSTFKRPEGYFAGKLIEDSGLKGFRVGGASVSEKHCGFVINDKNGTAKDIDELMKAVSLKVKENYGVELEPEVIRVGKF